MAIATRQGPTARQVPHKQISKHSVLTQLVTSTRVNSFHWSHTIRPVLIRTKMTRHIRGRREDPIRMQGRELYHGPCQMHPHLTDSWETGATPSLTARSFHSVQSGAVLETGESSSSTDSSDSDDVRLEVIEDVGENVLISSDSSTSYETEDPVGDPGDTYENGSSDNSVDTHEEGNAVAPDHSEILTEESLGYLEEPVRIPAWIMMLLFWIFFLLFWLLSSGISATHRK